MRTVHNPGVHSMGEQCKCVVLHWVLDDIHNRVPLGN